MCGSVMVLGRSQILSLPVIHAVNIVTLSRHLTADTRYSLKVGEGLLSGMGRMPSCSSYEAPNCPCEVHKTTAFSHGCCQSFNEFCSVNQNPSIRELITVITFLKRPRQRPRPKGSARPSSNLLVRVNIGASPRAEIEQF